VDNWCLQCEIGTLAGKLLNSGDTAVSPAEFVGHLPKIMSSYVKNAQDDPLVSVVLFTVYEAEALNSRRFSYHTSIYRSYSPACFRL
jgi:hypothetical protein